ncbi:wall-associated receptor kinase-like 20 [Forsythia ovata]|uniref:Wall-associated receptor kinase-like 20 n=1 Tax=Forsythia ovata TaxID=205694 RepID=A0ABD1SQF9_9LAMI
MSTAAVGVFLLLALSGFLVFRQRRYTKRAARNVLIKDRKEILNANNTSGKSSKIFTGKEKSRKQPMTSPKKTCLAPVASVRSSKALSKTRAKPGNAKATYQVLNEVRILCQVNHRDVKTSNILLDDKLDTKVSDFGLSRLVELSERDCTHIYTSAQGTLGYLDPEYYLNLQLTDWSDVYSFGVVLMELLTSKKAIDFNREEENVNLVVYMKRIMDEEKLMDVVDRVLKEGASKVELETIKAIGNLAAAWRNEGRIGLR